MKVLCVYGDVGAGHTSAAKALQEAFSKRYPHYQVECVDLFKIIDPAPWGDSNASFTVFSQNAFLRQGVSFFNHSTDTALGYWVLKRLVLKRTLAPYRDFIKSAHPDLVVSLHPLTNIPMAALRQEGLQFSYAVVVTDLISLMRSWADPTAEIIFSPSSKATQTLMRYGVGKARIAGPLFPIRASLQTMLPRAEVFARHGLDPTQTTLVLTGGGVGTRGYKNIIDSLAKSPYQLIVICGKDQEFARELQHKYQTNPKMVILGFVNDIGNYFGNADIVISKSGTLTVLELELLGTRTIFTHEVGAQEYGNGAYAAQSPRVRFLNGHFDRLETALEDLLANNVSFTPRRRFDEAEKIVKCLVELAKNVRG